jgi:outer membrane lipase/esterase
MWLRCVGALCALAIALSGAEPAKAQDYGTIVVFGDSLSDDGNMFAVSGIPPSPLYVGGRFSNGPVWVEQLQGYGADNVNLAFGGARTDDTNNFDPIPGALGVEEQIDQYLGSTGGTVQPGSLVVLWAGANDINAALRSGLNPVVAAGVAAQNQVGNLSELVQAGADTVLLPNLPNLGATPGAIGTGLPAVQQLLLFSTVTYNQTLDLGVRSLPLPAGTNIIQMDVFSAFRVILADPAAFGFTNVTQACLSVDACEFGSRAAQDQFLFWDDIHPTTAGHALLAQYASLLLSTETIAQAVAPLAEASFQARLESSQAAFGRTLNALAFPDIWRGGIFAEVIGNRFNGDGSGGVPDYRQDLAGIRAGVEGRIGGAIAGVAVSYAAGEHDQGGLSADTERAQADIYGTMRLGGFFVGADAGVSYSNHRNIERDTGFPTVTADGDTDGWGYSAAVNAGYVIGQGAFKLLPNVRLGYLSSSTDAFSESAPLLALEYGDRDISSGFWSAGIRAATTLNLGARPLQAFGEIGYEGLFATSADDITAHLVGNTALPVSAAVDDPAARGLYLRVGVDGQLNETTTLSVDYGLSLGDGDTETHSGKVAVKFLFGG